MRPDEDEDKFDHDPDGTRWELNTSEMTPKHMRGIPRRIRCLPFDVPWSQKTADFLAEEVALVVEMALLPPNAGADIAAKAGVHAALANLERALKVEVRIEALTKALPAKDAESLARVCMSFAADMLHKQDDIGQRFWTEQAKRLWAYADLATAGK